MMQFMDKCLSEDAIHTIEDMVKKHISGNYQDVRNTILGYNSKNDTWESIYGEYIANRHMFDMKPPISSPAYILRSKNSSKEETVDTFTRNNGMTFYDREVYENVRIYMDDSVKRVLELLFTLSKDVMEYRDIVDIIITDWDVNNVRDTIVPNGTYVDHGVCGNLHYHTIEVRKNSWEDLKKIAKHKGMTIRDAFKDSVITFLENRSEILKGNISQKTEA